MATPEEIAAAEAAEKKLVDDKAAEEAARLAAEQDDGISPEAKVKIADLQRQLEEQTTARQAADRRAAANAGAAAAAASEVDNANLREVITAIDIVKTTQDALKARLRDAMSGSDFDAAADIHVELSNNAAKLLQLENGKLAMEEEAKNPRRQATTEAAGDPVESLARTLTPKSADWVRKHPSFVTDPRLNRKMIRAHQDAIDDGCAPDSTEYFAYVEGRLGVNATATLTPANGADKDAEALSAAAAAQTRRDSSGATPPPAIPASRGGSSKNARTLTAEEKEIASLNGQTEEEYAKAKEALKAEGRLH